MTCQHLVDLVTDYLEGALSDDDRARFDEQSYAFSLSMPPTGIATGRYQLIRGAAQPDMLAHAYRLSHPLGEWSIDASLNAATPVATLKLDYGKHGARVSVIERLRGMSGWLTLALLVALARALSSRLIRTILILGLVHRIGMQISQRDPRELEQTAAEINGDGLSYDYWHRQRKRLYY